MDGTTPTGPMCMRPRGAGSSFRVCACAVPANDADAHKAMPHSSRILESIMWLIRRAFPSDHHQSLGIVDREDVAQHALGEVASSAMERSHRWSVDHSISTDGKPVGDEMRHQVMQRILLDVPGVF